MTGLLIRNSFLLAKAETDYGVLGSAMANTDALKIVSMEINPITGTRVERSLIKGSSAPIASPWPMSTSPSPSPLSGAAVEWQPRRRDSRRCCWPAA
jgi:hypothetical protein